MSRFDIAVIGGGPGGYVAAIKAAQYGKKVCLFEKGELGGVCLNRGCIPTKALLKSAAVLHEVRHAAQFGVTVPGGEAAALDFAAAQQRKAGVVKKLTGGVGMLLKSNQVTVFTGQAAFADKNTLLFGGERITADNIIIATGSQPARLPIPVSAGAPVITSDEALELKEIPRSLVVVGGGVIGVEFAYLFASLGTKVTIVEMFDRILPPIDAEVAQQADKMLRGLGIQIFCSAKATKIENTTLHFEQGSAAKQAVGEKILIAVGRTPNTEGLNLAAAGVAMDRKAIKTDERMKTNVPGIYAIGDVNGKSMLAHTASAEGLVAVDNIIGKASVMDYGRIPACVYTNPEIASIGMTEDEARQKHGDVKVGRFPFAANGKAMVEGESAGFIKVITEAKFGEILGVHMFGLHTTDMIASMAVAMTAEASAHEIVAAIHPHPTLSETVAEAFHAALDRAIHIP
ncbi:MAG TPA: dihydrolipoyl dehydrogenase [Negativicutes bacterium]|nr:dihydrolipoyl dehydrogenase [Negativicutes bacterium]